MQGPGGAQSARKQREEAAAKDQQQTPDPAAAPANHHESKHNLFSKPMSKRGATLVLTASMALLIVTFWQAEAFVRYMVGNRPVPRMEGDLIMSNSMSQTVFNIEGQEIGVGLSTKLVRISMDTRFKQFGKLYRVRVTVHDVEEGRDFDVWYMIKAVFLEEEGQKLVLYTVGGQEITMQRNGAMFIAVEGRAFTQYTLKPLRYRSVKKEIFPEIEGEVFCDEPGCTEGCPPKQYLANNNAGSRSCKPCVQGSSHDPKGLFPGMCFCADPSEMWLVLENGAQECVSASKPSSPSTASSQEKKASAEVPDKKARSTATSDRTATSTSSKKKAFAKQKKKAKSSGTS